MASMITKDDELRSFDVPEIARHPRGYTIYKIVLQITPKELTENSYQLVYWKRYSDIRKFYDTLYRYHQAIYRPEKFPNFPNKSSYMERFNPIIIEERRLATKEFLNFAVKYLYLRTHDAYINFFQNGEKVVLPDVETDTLKPESIITQQPQVSIPILPTPMPSISINKTTDELLLNVDEDEHVNSPSTKILDELNDLHFEHNDENKDDLNIIQIEPSDFIPLPSNTNNNDSSS
ncbi:unnamed protein product [Rotaria sp. Silwood2]|nr:unnamed protein product [Rotaria sp. Silwood2]CAF2961210.1 unnamed protein product [Rotaria sp. Silwood2]CAF3273396.1 unnamed protein product [Rotaria sp. Silwood2]CAF3359110.1 unnamed protein product [Rotaria sp. Silwood2]CAF3908697.1 unnamed protein product [Rotaria sp. Silwood2]